MSTICQIIEIALIASFIILFLGKTGLREKIRNYFDEKNIIYVANMIDCDFCLSFWMCVCVYMLLSIADGHFMSLIALICAAPLTRHFI